MFDEPVPVDTESELTKPLMPTRYRAVECRSIGVLCAALSGFWIAHGVALSSPGPNARVVVIWTGSLVVGSLAAFVVAIACFLSSAQSRLRHVFCGRRVLVFAGFLSVVGVALAGSIARRHPFRQLAARGQLTAVEIVDIGLVLAAIVCLIGVVVAFVGALDAYREERTWHRPLEASSR